jgi:hypothetical protein
VFYAVRILFAKYYYRDHVKEEDMDETRIVYRGDE